MLIRLKESYFLIIMIRSAYLIFNPVAGQGNSEQDLATIKSILEPEFDLEIQFTTKEVSGGGISPSSS